MKWFYLGLVLSVLVTACSDESAKPTATTTDSKAESIATTIVNTSQPPPASQPSAKLVSSAYQEIAWEALELPGQGMADIMRKYQPQLDAVSDNDQAAGDQLIDKLQAELNAAPINPELNGKKIKLSGFVTPLEIDEKQGKVKEFLLVPYFGACIHVPPPPVNQTLLIRPQPEHTINLEQIYSGVTVSGIITTKASTTKLAQAGYQIIEAQVEVMP